MPEEKIKVNKPKPLARPVFKNVAFFGDSHIPEDDKVYKDAFEIAKHLAEEGFTIVNGGGPGIMNAATQGASAVKGETISVTFYPEDAPGFEGRYLGNVTSQEIQTENYIERMFKLLEHADIFIIFKGGSGTLSEWGTAWVLGKLYYGHHKPFILYGSYWKDIVEVVSKNMNIDEEEMDVFRIVEKKDEILPTIRDLEEKFVNLDHSHCRVCKERAFMT